MNNKLWNWGHLETSHNALVKQDCKMTMPEFAKEYNVPNSFVVSYGGNIQAPFDDLAEKLSSIENIKWSILGDASSPLPEDRLGYTDYIIELSKKYKNVTGGVIDDFYSPKRTERFTPEVLTEIRKKLNDNGLDFWAVLYLSNIIADDINDYFDCFDGITYWIWDPVDLEKVEEKVEPFLTKFPTKRKMLGIYLWDYERNLPIEPRLFLRHMDYAKKLLDDGVIEGIVFCSGCIGDADLEANKILKEYFK